MAKKSSSLVRVRIAPSPTGNLHVGTARSALFNELFAHQHDGAFIVRIEDTDSARSSQKFEDNILQGLKWLGLTWQEGPDIGGDFGPYRQSERGKLYQTALRQLLAEKKAYYCDCDQKADPKPICRCAWHEKEGSEQTPIKLSVASQTVTFTDLVRGQVSAKTDTFGGDFIIARSITNPLFHLAVVVDDEAMNISHVIRGEDHISNTAKHILIQKALGYEPPIYAHIPLLLDDQKRKLSKRNAETSLLAYRDAGYLPEAMLNYLALLGWNPGNEQEYFSHDDLIKKFSIEKVQKGGAVFSIAKLKAMNKYYIRQLSVSELLRVATPFLVSANIDMNNTQLLEKALSTEQPRIETLADIPQLIAFFLPTWVADYEPSMLVWKKSNTVETQNILSLLINKTKSAQSSDFEEKRLQTLFMEWIDKESLDRGAVLWPMRVALTGKEHSPSPFEVAAILGQQTTIERLEMALHKMS